MSTASAVREKGIIFSGPMVRAILEGAKTQTRRVVTDQNTLGNWKPSQCDMTTAWVDPGPSPAGNPGPYLKAHVTARPDDEIVDRLYSRLWAGNQLWVRETFAIREIVGEPRLMYRADNTLITADSWKPSIFMPRWASRLSLEITGIRVERVQEISYPDIRAEGVDQCELHKTPHTCCDRLRLAYALLWDSLNAKRGYAWDSNPWVWVIEFRRVTP